MKTRRITSVVYSCSDINQCILIRRKMLWNMPCIAPAVESGSVGLSAEEYAVKYCSFSPYAVRFSTKQYSPSSAGVCYSKLFYASCVLWLKRFLYIFFTLNIIILQPECLVSAINFRRCIINNTFVGKYYNI